jgi:hypothetical protein
MGVDASIPLGVRPMQVADPLEKYAQVEGLRAQQQANALRAQQMQQAQEERAYGQQRRQGLNALLSQGATGDDLEQALLKGGYLDESLKIGKDRREMRKADAAAGKDEAETKAKILDIRIKTGDRVVQALSAAKDQASWSKAIDVLANDPEGGPDALKGIPQQFDPQFAQVMLQRTVPHLEQLKLEREKAKADEAARHNRASEGIQIRGQNMVDAREREVPRGVPLETGQGPVLVNPRTGQATPVTVGGNPVAAKQPEFAKKETAALDAQFNAIDGALKAVEQTPSAFGMSRGLATMAGTIPESVAQKMSSDEQIKARSFVYNNVSKIINERAGAAQSAQELARLRGFLPAETDDARVISAKLNGFKQYLAEQRKAYAPAASPAAASAGGIKFLGFE